MTDISNKNELHDYICKRRLFEDADAVPDARYLGGGVSGTVALISAGKSSLVIKQALPFLKVADIWESDPKRIRTEYEALKAYARIIPRYVPRPVCYDEDNFIMVREAVPESYSMWKSRLLTGTLEFKVAENAIKSLLEVHNKTAEDAGIRKTFLDDGVFYSLRIDPYIERVAEIYPMLAESAGELSKMLINEKIALVHGDYSPKNILVDNGDMFIIDMEVAHYGHPAFDVAFFANHFLLKSIKNKQWSDAYLNMLRWMLDIYFSGVEFMDKSLLEKQAAQTLAYLFLARVDGKSPAEYITLEEDKQLIRDIAFSALSLKIRGFDAFVKLIKDMIKNKQ